MLLAGLVACKDRQPAKLFEKLSSQQTGIDFTNTISENDEHNVLKYEYYYNGSGVAVGDVNNDGLADLFFTGNQVPSKLYLNRGGFSFEDVTTVAKVAGKKAWKTGVNMADVNGDGLMDIYVCYSAFGTDADRANQLFINQGLNKDSVPVFAEKAAEYGLDAPGTYTSQSAFFDFDRDGDLDMFLLNHANGFYSPFYNTTRLRNLRHPQFGNRLYRNDNSRFVDISEQAGIYGSGINFGLGISISDINNDGWPDVFVSNDFNEQDFFYLNNHDGTFKEVCKQMFAHISRSTMGTDIADYNNDQLLDVIAMDMLPETNYRQKILRGGDEYDQHTLMVDSGYGHQYSRNVLQLNRGFGPDGLPVFSEIGQLAGVSNTDWSWASLFTDLDNDGWKDLFVTNGYLRDYTNLDFIKYDVANAFDAARKSGKDVSTREGYEKNLPLFELVKKMPSTKLSNYVFGNKGDLSFADKTEEWGLKEDGISSGAAYTDLDNDGDLDLVVCNNNDPVWLYKNNAESINNNNYIKIKLAGDQQNIFGIGAKVFVVTDSTTQVQEMYPVRGYQSSVDYTLNFGLGKTEKIKEVRVKWTNDSVTIINSPAPNKLLIVSKNDAVADEGKPQDHSLLFTDITTTSGVDFQHKENPYVDFKHEFLIPYQLSKQGPGISKADVNKDGLEDFFVGGAYNQSGVLFIQVTDGKFQKAASQPWSEDVICEDVSSLFFDADGDGDEDLYVVSGGNERDGMRRDLQDRLYLNDGRGNFSKSPASLPDENFAGSCVATSDYDKDGDLDLFIGSRSIPGNYPYSAGNIILRNEGNANFRNVTVSLTGNELFNAGMITSAVWSDIDKDGWPDLVVAGDWMPVKIFHNEVGKALKPIANTGLENTAGWWCRILPVDIDKDGDMDFIAGNMGTNSQFKTSAEHPLITYSGDFNNDGKTDPIMTWYIQGVSYPFNSRDELIEQMPHLNKKFLKYADFGNATIDNIITAEQKEKSDKFYIHDTRSSVLINDKGRFTLKPLPLETQFSMVSGILYRDFNGDGVEDILAAGNFFPFRVQQGRCDASMGSLLTLNKKGDFETISRQKTGLFVTGDVRDMIELKGKSSSSIIIAKNNGAIQVLRTNK